MKIIPIILGYDSQPKFGEKYNDPKSPEQVKYSVKHPDFLEPILISKKLVDNNMENDQKKEVWAQLRQNISFLKKGEEYYICVINLSSVNDIDIAEYRPYFDSALTAIQDILHQKDTINIGTILLSFFLAYTNTAITQITNGENSLCLICDPHTPLESLTSEIIRLLALHSGELKFVAVHGKSTNEAHRLQVELSLLPGNVHEYTVGKGKPPLPTPPRAQKTSWLAKGLKMLLGGSIVAGIGMYFGFGALVAPLFLAGMLATLILGILGNYFIHRRVFENNPSERKAEHLKAKGQLPIEALIAKPVYMLRTSQASFSVSTIVEHQDSVLTRFCSSKLVKKK